MQLKNFKDTGYYQVISQADKLSILDKPWIATHMREARSYELNNIKNVLIITTDKVYKNINQKNIEEKQ